MGAEARLLRLKPMEVSVKTVGEGHRRAAVQDDSFTDALVQRSLENMKDRLIALMQTWLLK